MNKAKFRKMLEDRLALTFLARCARYACGMRRLNEQIISEFLGDEISMKERRRHLRKMRRAFLRDAYYGNEYFIFHYDSLSRKGIKRYVTDRHKDLMARRLNSREAIALFDDKMATYTRYKEYYHRDVCLVLPGGGAGIARFVEKHKCFIVKPNNGSLGSGIKIVTDATADNVFELLDACPTGLILEELIVQDSEMASVYPLSVNTIRLHTVTVDGKTHIIRPFAKFGRGGNIVDNGAQGGLLAAIDINTGVITYACDIKGNPFISHPDTEKVMLGFQIPRWEEAKQKALELAAVWPEAGFVGWDLACTADGWVMVEGNGFGQLVAQQLTYRSGVADELRAIYPDCMRSRLYMGVKNLFRKGCR